MLSLVLCVPCDVPLTILPRFQVTLYDAGMVCAFSRSDRKPMQRVKVIFLELGSGCLHTASHNPEWGRVSRVSRLIVSASDCRRWLFFPSG